MAMLTRFSVAEPGNVSRIQLDFKIDVLSLQTAAGAHRELTFLIRGKDRLEGNLAQVKLD